MDMPHGRVPEATPTAFDDLDATVLSPLDPAEEGGERGLAGGRGGSGGRGAGGRHRGLVVGPGF